MKEKRKKKQMRLRTIGAVSCENSPVVVTSVDLLEPRKEIDGITEKKN